MKHAGLDDEMFSLKMCMVRWAGGWGTLLVVHILWFAKSSTKLENYLLEKHKNANIYENPVKSGFLQNTFNPQKSWIYIYMYKIWIEIYLEKSIFDWVFLNVCLPKGGLQKL